MARSHFIRQLEELGHRPTVYATDNVVIPYTVEVGRFAGKALRLGLQVADDFPLTAPGGVHISPALLEMHPSNDLPHPAGGVHESPFTSTVGGEKWQYWSRPFRGWGQTDKTVRIYLAFVRLLFDTQ